MGYRSDVGLCLAGNAVRELKKRLAAPDPGAGEERDVRSLFAEADVRLASGEGGESLWVWRGIKWYHDDPVIRFVESLLAELDEEDFLLVRVGEDYADVEHRGFLWDNAFALNVARRVVYEIPRSDPPQAAGPGVEPPASDRSPHFAELRMCDASTTHIHPRDNDILAGCCRRSECDTVIAYPCERGYFLYLDKGIDDKESDYAERMARAGFSAEFAALLRLAARAGFDWLKLDADAPAYPELPIFEW